MDNLAVSQFRPAEINRGETNSRIHLMSVDVEDYFQVQAMAGVCGRSDWDDFEPRVGESTSRILDLFAEQGITSTFFTLGWVAERHPDLMRRIVDEGHELASHGWEHKRVFDQTPQAFQEDITRTKKLLEDVSGKEVRGYRAATFSILKRNLWAFEELEGAGYRYSSSVYPIIHDLYGFPDAPRDPFLPIKGSDFLEIPMPTRMVGGKTTPGGGGGYFRLLPYFMSRRIIRSYEQSESRPFIFYMHPWEIDHQQPRINGLPLKSRFRHYLNLSKTEPRLRRLTQDFSWQSFADWLGNDHKSGGSNE